MEIRRNFGSTLFTTGRAPSNPPPQRQAILRSLSGRLAADPGKHTLSPLFAQGRNQLGRMICMPVFML